MKRALIVSMLAVAWFSPLAQVKFEKGYFIDNNDNKIECFIKNVDWKDNPENFEYKKTEQDEPTLINISEAMEFGVVGISKYIRASVKIDRSSNYLDQLSRQRDPVWSEEQLFLNVLREGEGSLYVYQDGNLFRFFYKINDNPIRQLIHKKYLNDAGVATNFDFRQQLWIDFRCPDATSEILTNLSYTEKSLLKYFQDANACHGDNTEVFKPKRNKVLFLLRITPGIEYSGLEIWNTQDFRYGITTFDKQLTYRIGIQTEFILPYNKNKWAIIVEPTFQSFHAEKQTGAVAGNATVQYNSIEIPFGARHYFFINDKSKFFINTFLVFDYTFDSFVKFRNDPAFKDIRPRPSVAAGAGYEVNKLSLELRFYIDRKIMGDYLLWYSKYNKLSFIVGYTVF